MTAEQRRKHCRQFLTNFVAGDNDAFNEFYQLLYPALFRFGLTVTNQREEVRDQLQDLFVWVYENAGRLLQKTDPELYLLAAIRNRIRKRLNRRRLFPTAAEELHALVTTEPAFTDKMQTEEEEKRRRTALAQQLAALPSRQQQVIYLRFYEGKSYEDIALVMDTKVQVVRNFVYRGLQKLRASKDELKQAMILAFGLEWMV